MRTLHESIMDDDEELVQKASPDKLMLIELLSIVNRNANLSSFQCYNDQIRDEKANNYLKRLLEDMGLQYKISYFNVALLADATGGAELSLDIERDCDDFVLVIEITHRNNKYSLNFSIDIKDYAFDKRKTNKFFRSLDFSKDSENNGTVEYSKYISL